MKVCGFYSIKLADLFSREEFNPAIISPEKIPSEKKLDSHDKKRDKTW